MQAECIRCGRDIKFVFVADDGTRLYEDPDGLQTCEDFIDWDKDGEFRPAHTPEETD